MQRQRLRKALLAAMGASLLGSAGEAGAFGSSSIGTFTGTAITVNSSAPFKSFSDYQAHNQGWVHTARYWTLQIGSAADIAGGVLYDVQMTLAGRGNLNLHTGSSANAMNNPAFVLWTAGTGTIDTASVSGQGHGWNPTRGIGETGTDLNGNPSTVLTNTMIGAAGILNGHEGWIGYANSGPTYTLINDFDPLGNQLQSSTGVAVHDTVSHGALNTTSLTWLTNPGPSSTAYTDDYYRVDATTTAGTQPDYAMMTLYGLRSGRYLIAAGGSCPGYPDDGAAADACGNDGQITFTVATAPPAPVPLPAAVWLFGSALAGLVAAGRRRITAPA